MVLLRNVMAVGSTAVDIAGGVVVCAAATGSRTLESRMRVEFGEPESSLWSHRAEPRRQSGHSQNGSGIHCEKNQKPWSVDAGAGAGASGCVCAGTGFGWGAGAADAMPVPIPMLANAIPVTAAALTRCFFMTYSLSVG